MMNTTDYNIEVDINGLNNLLNMYNFSVCHIHNH